MARYHVLGQIPAATAREIISAFLYAEPNPPCDAAVNENGDTLGFEWTFPDGRSLWIDVGAHGAVNMRWHKPEA